MLGAHPILVGLKQTVDVVCGAPGAVVLGGHPKELLRGLQKCATIGHLQRPRIPMGGLPWCNLVRLTLEEKKDSLSGKSNCRG